VFSTRFSGGIAHHRGLVPEDHCIQCRCATPFCIRYLGIVIILDTPSHVLENLLGVFMITPSEIIFPRLDLSPPELSVSHHLQSVTKLTLVPFVPAPAARNDERSVSTNPALRVQPFEFSRTFLLNLDLPSHPYQVRLI
jgi:hypothetical protein